MHKDLIPLEAIHFIANVGLVGIERGMFNESMVIFDAIVKMYPEDLNAKILQGMGEVFMGKLVKGTQKLFEVLKQDPENDRAKAFVAVAMRLGQVDEEAKALIQHLLQHAKDPDALSLAQELQDSYKLEMKPQQLNAEQARKVTKEAYVY